MSKTWKNASPLDANSHKKSSWPIVTNSNNITIKEQKHSKKKLKTKPKTQCYNIASRYARGAFRSEISRIDGQLNADMNKILRGGCIYIRNFLCSGDNFNLLTSITNDLSNNPDCGMINWSRHHKHENPTFSPTFHKIIHAMSDYFDVEVYATRLNFYSDSRAWKPFHQDSHAYGSNGQKEDFTMGASFGASRDLSFRHMSTQNAFNFPQHNGDIFAFTSEVNSSFQHGIPKAKTQIGPRFSIIAWGRRRTLNKRNSTKDEQEKNAHRLKKNGTQCSLISTSDSSYHQSTNEKAEITLGVDKVSKMIETFVLKKEANKIESEKRKDIRRQNRRKSRIQGGWNGHQARRGHSQENSYLSMKNKCITNRGTKKNQNQHYYNNT